MAIIKIKGMGQKEIDRAKAQQIKDRWVKWKQQPARDRVDSVVDMDDLAFSMSEITSIDLSLANFKTDYHEGYAEKRDSEYENERKRILALSPEEHAKRLGFVRVYWKIMTCGKEIPEQEKPRIMEMQKQFFIENPKRQFIDPWLLNQVVRPYCEKKAIATMSVIEEIIRADKYYARTN